METDDYLNWKQAGAFLAKNSSNNNLFIAYGDLNKKINLEINKTF